MSREFTINLSVSYLNADMDDAVIEQIVDLIADQTTKKETGGQVEVGTSEEAIPMGEVTSPGWFFARNLDDTNFIELRVATAGAKFAKLGPGQACLLRLGSGATAPYAIADTAACMMRYRVWNN